MIERYKIVNREDWLKKRSEYTTGSTVPALPSINAHAYMTPTQLYLRRRGVIFPERDTGPMERGRRLEAVTAEIVGEQRPDWKLIKNQYFYFDDEWGLGVTIDYEIHNDPRGLGVLEIKTCAPSVWERDWDNGREVPLATMLQTETGIWGTEAKFGAIAVMVINAYSLDVHLVEIPRHDGAIEKIKQGAREFKEDIAAGREPKVNFGRDSDAIRAMTAKATAGKAFDATGHNELPVILAQRAALKARIKEDEARCKAIENEIKHLLGDAVTISNLPGWRVTFNNTDYKESFTPAHTTRVLRVFDKRPAIERPAGGDDEVAA